MTYVAVWKGGRYLTGPQKGRRVFSFLAMASTRREARERAYAIKHPGGTLTQNLRGQYYRDFRRWQQSRRKQILVVRYGTALLLDGITQRDFLRLYGQTLGLQRGA